jgi:CheY-like chemotaxis protein
VLVVDDNRDAAKSLGQLLKIHGVAVQVVHDGPAALDKVEEFRPHIVLLDLGMPGMDGFEVAQKIRANPAMKDVLLVALTGWGQEEDRRRTHAAGFNHHLVKPLDVALLKPILTPGSDLESN